jgi:hypothetical protein
MTVFAWACAFCIAAAFWFGGWAAGLSSVLAAFFAAWFILDWGVGK